MKTWNEDDMNCGNANLNEDMIVAVVSVSLSSSFASAAVVYSVYRLLELYIRIDETQCKRLLLTQFNRSNKYKYNVLFTFPNATSTLIF